MPLNSNQIAQLAGRLGSRYTELLKEVRSELADGASQHIADLLDRTPGDAGDVSVADALADLNVVLIDRHIHELRDIEAARARIRESAYGTCIDCGGEIPYERLRAYPTAKRCVTCQGHREKTYAQSGTPSM